MNVLGILSGLFAIIFVLLLLASWSRLRKGRFLKAGFYAMPASLAFLSFALLLLVISNLSTYQRLTSERDILLISTQKISNQNYQVELNYVDTSDNHSLDTVYLQGDEWRLEAKILKWKGWANLLGMDSYYQLDRISGRYRDIEQATSKPVSAFQITHQQRGINLWELKRLMKSNLPFLDAYFGQAIFLPLRDDAIFAISINQAGLVARPANNIAIQALENW